MGFSNILLLLYGLALFLFGMDTMGDALKRSAGGKLKSILERLTSNKFKGFLLGMGVTAIIQSSSATTVMTVGLVSSGTMLLGQAVSVIIGANVGTSVTSWITALNGIEGGDQAAAALGLLKPSVWVPVLAIIGIGLMMFSKHEKRRDIGRILLGFSVLMAGMDTMSDAVSVLRDNEGFRKMLIWFKNPIFGILAGAVMTAIIQSSSASVGILQALSSTGAISYSIAIPIIMGQNIGTCVTAMLSSIGANREGKRAAIVHLTFNICGVVMILALYYALGWIFELSASGFSLFALADAYSIDMWGIAAAHTVFNVISAAALLPLSRQLESLACRIVKEEKEAEA